MRMIFRIEAFSCPDEFRVVLRVATRLLEDLFYVLTCRKIFALLELCPVACRITAESHDETPLYLNNFIQIYGRRSLFQ